MFVYDNLYIIGNGKIVIRKNQLKVYVIKLENRKNKKEREEDLCYLFNCSYLGFVFYNFRIFEFISNVELFDRDFLKYNFEVFEFFQI